jgi:hypothetical protein
LLSIKTFRGFRVDSAPGAEAQMRLYLDPRSLRISIGQNGG